MGANTTINHTLKMYSSPVIYASFSNPNRSIAPLIYNAAFNHLNFNCTYVAFECRSAKIATDVIRDLNLGGASLSMPFKCDCLEFADELDDEVQKIGAANLIVNSQGALKGYNTDGSGAIECIKRHVNLYGKSVAIIGAGGAAKAIAYHAKLNGASVKVFNRTLKNAKKLYESFELEGFGSLDEWSTIQGCEVIINATPMGSTNLTQQEDFHFNLSKDHTILDIIIENCDTPLIYKAKLSGCNYSTGLEMYIRQAASAFKIFTNTDAPLGAMLRAAGMSDFSL